MVNALTSKVKLKKSSIMDKEHARTGSNSDAGVFKGISCIAVAVEIFLH